MTIERSIHSAPDERSGGSDNQTQDYPETVEVDGQQVPFEDLVNGFKFTRANDERAAELRREREVLESEREEWRREREQAAQERQAHIDALSRLAPQADTGTDTPEPPQLNYREAIGQIDLITDTDASHKLGELFDTALAVERENDRQEWQHRIEELNQQWEDRLNRVQQETATRLSRTEAQRAAREHNDKLFDETMQTKYGDVVEQIGEDGLAAVRKTFEALISPEYGQLDNAGEWRWNSKAVDAAVRATDASHGVILARTATDSRTQQLGAQLRGDDATRSTPIHLQRTAVTNPDDALMEKRNQFVQMVRSGMSQEEAFDRLDFSEAELKTLQDGRYPSG